MIINRYILEEIMNKHDANMTIKRLERIVVSSSVMLQIPTVRRGKDTTCFFPIAHYDITEAIKRYKERVKRGHPRWTSRIKAILRSLQDVERAIQESRKSEASSKTS